MKNSLFVLLFATLLVSAIALAYKAARSVFIGWPGDSQPSVSTTAPPVPGVKILSSAVLSFDQQSGAWQGAQKIVGANIAEAKNVYRFLFDPTDARRLFAATSRGLFVHDKDTDVWTQLGVGTLPDNGAVTAVAVDAQDPLVVFAASSTDQLTSLLWRSQDRGKTFQNVYSSPAGGGTINGLAVDFSDPRNVFALFSAGSLLQSDDFGLSWKIAHTFPGIVMGSLVVDPNNSNNVYIYSSESAGLFSSTDKGRTWQDGSSALASFPQQAQRINALRVVRGNSAVLYLATDYGILRSRDRGTKFDLVPFLVAAGSAPILDLEIGPAPDDLFAVVDNQLYISADAGATWQVRSIPAQGTVSAIAVNPFNANLIFTGIKR